MKRRTLLGLAGAGTLAATAGCMDIVSGDTIEYRAAGATVPESVSDETGYDFVDTHEITVNEPVGMAGISRDVIATNIQTEFEKTVSIDPLGSAPAAAFSIIATPSVSILGREFNPVADMSTEEIAELIRDNYDGMGDLSYQETETHDVGGESVAVSEYLADASLDGTPIDLELLISEAVSFDDDLVLAIGAYPTLTPAEESNIRSLMAAIEPM